MPKKLRNLLIDRVDLVKAGDNPTAHVALFKRKGGDANEGEQAFLEKMEQVIRNVLHINKKGDEELMSEALKKYLEALSEEQRTAVTDPLTKATEGMDEEQVSAFLKTLIAKEEEGEDDALKAENADLKEKLKAALAKDKKDEDVDKEDIWKGINPEVRKRFEKQEQDLVEAQKLTKKLEDEKLEEKYVQKAASLTHLGTNAQELGPVLKRLGDSNEKDLEYISSVLKAASEAIERGKLFDSYGADDGPEGDAYEKAAKMARDRVAKGAEVSFEQALADVFRENPELYNEHRAEQVGEGVQ